MLKPTRSVAGQTAAALVILSGAAAFAHGGATGIVKERMEAMKALGASGKALAAMARNEAPFDPEAAAAHADVMAAHGGDSMTALFPEGSLKDPSEALPEIWDEWERFTALADLLQDNAAALKAAARTGDIDVFRPAFAKVAGTCGACHEDFREKK
jgi:cytochrome c556